MTTTTFEIIAFFNAHRNSTNQTPWLRRLVRIPLLTVCLALLPTVQATPGEGPAAPRIPQEVSAGPEIPEAALTIPQAPLPGFNTADGDHALFNVTTGNSNSAFGWYALFADTDGSFNTGLGAAALALNNGNQNTAVGTAALLFNTTGSNNTAVGVLALENNEGGNSNTAVGRGALANNIDGVEHTAVGSQALTNNTSANDNTAVGLLALSSNVDGTSNTAVGAAALRDNVSGDNNQALGRGALRFCTGNNNIAIGREAGANMTTANNVISIGSPGDGSAFTTGDRCFIGNIRGVNVGNSDGIPVIVDSDGQLGTSNSSRRFKKDIKAMDQTSEAILALKPVTFHYKDHDTEKAQNTPQFGLIAEDVAETNPDLVVRDADGQPVTVRYDAINAMLLNEFLKEHRAFTDEQRKVKQLETAVADLIATVKEQATQIQKVNAQLEGIISVPRLVSHEE